MTVLRRTASRSRPRRGASAVEFALVAPLLFLAIFSLIEFGRMVMVHQALTNAAREGSRQASLATTTSRDQVDAIVRDYLHSVIPNAANVDEVRVTINPESFADITSGTTVSVAVQVGFAGVSWLPESVFGQNLNIAAQSVRERE